MILCRLCHAETKCMIVGHIYLENGPCKKCGKDLECVDCGADRYTKEEMILMYRNTKTVEYGGGFV